MAKKKCHYCGKKNVELRLLNEHMGCQACYDEYNKGRPAPKDSSPEDGTIEEQLTKALMKGDIEKTKELIELGAYIDNKVSLGKFLFSYVYTYPVLLATKYPQTLELLINAGAKLRDVQNPDSQATVLHEAAKNSGKSVELLLNEGLEDGINDKDIEGKTPLHYAVSADNNESVSVLLKNGADPNIVDDNGQAPLALSKKETGIPENRDQKPNRNTNENSKDSIAAKLKQAGGKEKLPLRFSLGRAITFGLITAIVLYGMLYYMGLRRKVFGGPHIDPDSLMVVLIVVTIAVALYSGFTRSK